MPIVDLYVYPGVIFCLPACASGGSAMSWTIEYEYTFLLHDPVLQP